MDILQNDIKKCLRVAERLGKNPAKENEKYIAILKMALEKQVEVEPEDGNYCPKCGHKILLQRQSYCSYCGQKMKRSE